MGKNTIDSVLYATSKMSDMGNRINSILNPHVLQHIQKSQEIIDKILNPPALQQIKMAQEALDKIVNPSTLRFMDQVSNATALSIGFQEVEYQQRLTEALSAVNKSYLENISSLNYTLQDVNVFSSINSLRNSLPNSFAYEHNDKKFFDEEIYDKIFKKGDNWSVKLEENSLAVTYKNGSLEIAGTEIREVVAAKKLFPELAEGEIVNFITYLKKFPFLAVFDEKGTSTVQGIGVRIFNALQEKAVNYTTVIPAGTLVYRARELDKNKIAYFSEEEMLEADTGIPNIGRFNPYGVPLLYTSENSETAKKELGKNRYQIAEIKIIKPLHILDLKESGGLLYKYCSLPKSSKNYNPEEYMLSNFLGQCGCYLKTYRNIDLDGFKYESTKNRGNYCYVFFEVHKPNILINEICYEKNNTNSSNIINKF